MMTKICIPTDLSLDENSDPIAEAHIELFLFFYVVLLVVFIICVASFLVLLVNTINLKLIF